MLELQFSASPEGFHFEKWHLKQAGSTIGTAAGPSASISGLERLRDGKGWKVVVLCVLRIKLNAAPNECLLGGENESARDLARDVAQQLYKKGGARWLQLLFGGPVTTARAIKQLVRFDNPLNLATFVGIFASSDAERFRGSQILVGINGRQASQAEIAALDTALALELGVPAWMGRESLFVGRNRELALLSEFENGETNIVQIVAAGGQGKTTLVKRWLGGDAAFFWPFYRQGLQRSGHLPFNPFRRGLDVFLGLETKDDATQRVIVNQWLEAIRKRPCWIILDGCEVMLNGENSRESGRFAYPELEEFIQKFPKVLGAGIILTSRLPVVLPGYEIPVIQLEEMKPEWITEIFLAYGLTLSGTLRKKAIKMTGGSPLVAHLLSTLATQEENPSLGMANVLTALGRNERNMIASLFKRSDRITLALAKMLYRHETLLMGTHELALLLICSAFQREPESDALVLLLESVEKLKMGVPPVSIECWLAAAARLRDLGLAQGEGLHLTLHPLVQNYFSDSLQKNDRKLWEGIHQILYNHYKDSVLQHRPKDMPSLMMLLDAIVHGCQMGDPLRSYNEVAFDRFAHGYEIFPLCHLGAVHEMVAGLDAIRCATNTGVASNNPKWYCGFSNTNAIVRIASGKYVEATDHLHCSLKAGLATAYKSEDPEFIGIVLLALIHRIRIVGWTGNFLTKGLPALRKLDSLSRSRSEVLKKHEDANPGADLDAAKEYIVSHICEFLLQLGWHGKVAGELRAVVENTGKRLGSNVTLLPGLAARPHGELLAATGSAFELLDAVERGEAQFASTVHEFSNTESYLHGLALLRVAFATTDSARRAELASQAKVRLDEAVEIAVDRRQFHFEAPARLLRAEWAIGVDDERLALGDIRSVQSRSEALNWSPFLIRGNLLMARYQLRTGNTIQAEKLRKSAARRSTLSGYSHPWVKAHIGTHGPKHLAKLAGIKLE